MHEDLPSLQLQAIPMLCTGKTHHHPLTSNNKHDARGQCHVGFCRILHAANTDAFQSKNAHKKAEDAQDDPHDHEGSHSLEHCCRIYWQETEWVTKMRFSRAWEVFKDCFCLKIKIIKKKNLINGHQIYFQCYLGHLWKCGCSSQLHKEFDSLDVTFCKCSLAPVVIYSAEIHALELMYRWDKRELFHNWVEKTFFHFLPKQWWKQTAPPSYSWYIQLLCDSKWSSYVPALQ